jgi:hypothetical protein
MGWILNRLVSWQKAIPSKESRVVEDLLSQVAYKPHHRLLPPNEPRHRACLVMRCLRIPQGADPNSIDDGGSPALALAVTNKCPLALLQALLMAGADPDAAAPTGSPLQVR